eukprot:Skav234932  [mRNA]  locus=scaffold2677:97735:103280:+ [translate_table: standard]
MPQEPSVQTAVTILRGLKERYAAHHGVSIQDAALVAAANLSDRYITTRFLPDKANLGKVLATLRPVLDQAVDLLDEAGGWFTVEVKALSKEKARKELSSLNEELAPLRARYQQDGAAPPMGVEGLGRSGWCWLVDWLMGWLIGNKRKTA